ncbi:hypothetical protein EH240_12350 [Mesorhizobium tamadayense]|uniref:Uncharacterized protein n=1 Tax=Mesorhizobium tamadayense TaxID=425306 RepID=A0A3P3FUG0_9HYPH|nr:hypothetical protein [Mesorhizobium tamadayense]RRI02256.1 hypothetical protein EH240_12350 [Mesorhizobium tamadayense]
MHPHSRLTAARGYRFQLTFRRNLQTRFTKHPLLRRTVAKTRDVLVYIETVLLYDHETVRAKDGARSCYALGELADKAGASQRETPTRRIAFLQIDKQETVPVELGPFARGWFDRWSVNLGETIQSK